MFYATDLFLGPIRMILFFVFVYFLNRLVTLKLSNQVGLDYFIPRYTMLISVLVLSIFLLTMIKAYDFMTVLILFVIMIVLSFINIKRKKSLNSQLKKIKTRLIIYVVKTLEYKRYIVSFKNFRKNKDQKKTDQELLTKKDRKWQIVLGLLLAFMGFFSRFFFFKFDTFTLSDPWYKSLKFIKDISNQEWFFHKGTMMGDYAIMNFYGALTDISDLIIIETFGLLESALLTVIIFWVIYKITHTKFIPGLIAALSFLFLYAFLPLNFNLLVQHKPSFLALTLALPTAIFILNPTYLRKNHKSYFIWITLIFTACFFIDFFVTMIVVLPLLFLSFVLTFNCNKSYLIRAFAGFNLAFLCILGIHFFASIVYDKNLINFFASNLFSLSIYSYNPQLIAPIPQLIIFYQWIAAVTSIFAFILYMKDKKKWKQVIVFLVYINFLLGLCYFSDTFLDIDLLYQVISVFVPILLGISFFVILKFLSFILPTFKVKLPVRVFLTGFFITLVILFLSEKPLSKIPYKKNLMKEQIIQAYDRLDSKLLPYSYAVANTYQNSAIGKNSHYFIDYDFFNNGYLEQDLLYHLYKRDEDYLTKNPEIILPKSTFVFIYNERLLADDFLSKPTQERALEIITEIKNRGRKVNLFFDKSMIKVYEIENEPKSSKIKELIF